MSDSLTADEIIKLATAFNKLNVRPRTDSPEELVAWMQEYTSQFQGSISDSVDLSVHSAQAFSPISVRSPCDAKSEDDIPSSEIKEMKTMVVNLSQEIAALKESYSQVPEASSLQQPPTWTPTDGCYKPCFSAQETQTYSVQEDHNSWYPKPRPRRGWIFNEEGYQVPICFRCSQTGHMSYSCGIRLDHVRSPRYYDFRYGMNYQGQTRRERNMQGLVGKANEVEVTVNGVKTDALLDTGATVSSISETFYRQQLSHIPIETLDDILRVECADGKQLPYLGFIEVPLYISWMMQEEQTCMFFIVPESDYNSSVPLLIGTNILGVLMDKCKEQHGDRFLQQANLRTPWYLAFRCMVLREKNLVKQQYRLCTVKSAETKRFTIPPNSQVTIRGYVHKPLEYQPTCAILQMTRGSVIPFDLDIAPSLVTFKNSPGMRVDVHISNVTTRTVSIHPRATLCEMQPVHIHDLPIDNSLDDTDLVGKMDFTEASVSAEQLMEGKKVIRKFMDIFSTGDTDVGRTDRVVHRIEVTDEHPFKQRHRRIPPSMYQEVRDHLQQLLAADIIRHSHSPWSSNVVLVRKKNGNLRICVDFRQLNRRTIRDNYSLPRIDELLDALKGSKCYSTLDMKSG